MLLIDFKASRVVARYDSFVVDHSNPIQEKLPVLIVLFANMSSKSNKGVKLSLGEFMGPAAAGTATSSLPKGPAQRAPDDDGSFKRPVRRSDNYNDQPPSRSEGDGNWRRGGGGSNGAPSSGFGPSNSSSNSDNYNDQAPSRSEGDGNWRRGGVSHSGGGNRDSYSNNRTGGGFDDNRGAGSYNRDSESGNSSGASNNWRGGGMSRENANPTPSLIGERPRLQLKSRTVPTNESTPETNNSLKPSPDSSTKNSKPNPFGSAVAVDKASNPTEVEEINPKFPSGSSAVDDSENTNEKSNSGSAEDKNETITVIEGAEATATVAEEMSEAKLSVARPDKKEKVKREPDTINSRAAAFGASNNSGTSKSEVCCQHSNPVTPNDVVIFHCTNIVATNCCTSVKQRPFSKTRAATGAQFKV